MGGSETSGMRPAGRKRQDLTGKRFGKLLVLEYVQVPNGSSKWKCQCDCGTITYKTSGHLNSGSVSCGCSKNIDLIGKRFGNLVVLEKVGKNSSRSIVWKCQCDCGNICEKPTRELNAGTAVSCGCKWRQPTVQAGERYGKLTAIRPTEKRSAQSIVWECKCECGTMIEVRATMLTSGHTTSCGCVKKAIDQERDFKDILTYVDGTCIEFAQAIGEKRANTSPETGVRGVIQKNGKYQAHINFKKKRYYLGTFTKLEDAVEVRKRAEYRVEEFVEDYLNGIENPRPIQFY